MMTAPRHRGNGATTAAGTVCGQATGHCDAAGRAIVVLESAFLR